MNYILTGNQGFIASHLEYRLLEMSPKINYLGVDVKNGKDLRKSEVVSLLPDCDILFHLAATNGTRLFYENPGDVLVNNTIPTLNLVERYRAQKTKFVFASTCEIFNGATDLGIYGIPTDEDVPVVFKNILNPRWSYSLPKALGENLVANVMENWLILRYFNIYGPGQKDHFIDEFVKRILSGEYYINGDDTRSFCYVEDAVNLTLKVTLKASNEIVNIGSNDEIKISDLSRIILKKMGINPSRLEVRAGSDGSAQRRCPDVSKVMKYTSYSYLYDIEKGIEKTLESIL